MPASYYDYSITLPPGWASRFSDWTAGKLWATSNRAARTAGQPLSAMVVTSPHYLPLVVRARPHVPTFYYCSDDYSQYARWGGASILQREAAVAHIVTHSFFVSELLAERAIREYGVPSERVSVSPNATDEAFLKPVPENQIHALLASIPQLRRPLVGVVGEISDRLDFDLLLACAEHLGDGTLVLIGPIANDLYDPGLTRLRKHPQCVFAGSQPHTDLPTWMQMIDIALIPYRDTPINRSCSPMRLFDHMASGRPIVSTAACQQIAAVGPSVRVGHTQQDIVELVRETLKNPPSVREAQAQRVQAEAQTWFFRAKMLARVINAQAEKGQEA
jgi:glycosyltransferase involved in cell wall biosynthesis